MCHFPGGYQASCVLQVNRCRRERGLQRVAWLSLSNLDHPVKPTSQITFSICERGMHMLSSDSVTQSCTDRSLTIAIKYLPGLSSSQCESSSCSVSLDFISLPLSLNSFFSSSQLVYFCKYKTKSVRETLRNLMNLNRY